MAQRKVEFAVAPGPERVKPQRTVARPRSPAGRPPPKIPITVLPKVNLQQAATHNLFEHATTVLPAGPYCDSASTSLSTRGPTEADLDVPVGQKLQRVVYCPNMPEQLYSGGKELMESVDLSKMTFPERIEMATRASPSFTGTDLAGMIESEKDTEDWTRAKLCGPSIYILKHLLRDRPLPQGEAPLSEIEKEVGVPHVSSAPGSHIDPEGVTRKIVPDAIFVDRLYPGKKGLTQRVFVVHEDKTHHVLPADSDKSPLNPFYVLQKDIEVKFRSNDSLPATRFVSPTEAPVGSMKKGSKILLQVFTQSYVYDTPFAVISSLWSTTFAYRKGNTLYISKPYVKGMPTLFAYCCWILAASGRFKDKLPYDLFLPKANTSWWSEEVKAHTEPGLVPYVLNDTVPSQFGDDDPEADATESDRSSLKDRVTKKVLKKTGVAKPQITTNSKPKPEDAKKRAKEVEKLAKEREKWTKEVERNRKALDRKKKHMEKVISQFEKLGEKVRKGEEWLEENAVEGEGLVEG